MEQYEKETGKSAIWRGKITEGFKRWKKGEKSILTDKERLSVYISKEKKSRWQAFATVHNYSTFSKLIREGVDYYIKEKSKPFSRILTELDADVDFSISHELKERLTTIKGYLQLLIEDYTGDLNDEVITILGDILEESKQLEDKIVKKFNNVEGIIEKYDVLLIEDDISTVTLIKKFFKRKGYSLKGVLTGSKGIEELKLISPKLILLDIMLPDISGFEICKILKSDENYRNIVIYYLTAVPNGEVEKKMEETQADGYILKPFDLSELEFLFKYL